MAKILIVEDDDSIRELIKMTLSMEDYTAFPADGAFGEDRSDPAPQQEIHGQYFRRRKRRALPQHRDKRSTTNRQKRRKRDRAYDKRV